MAKKNPSVQATDGTGMEFLVKRLLVILLASAVFTVALFPLEKYIKTRSTQLSERDMLEFRFSYTGPDLYKAYDELGFENLRVYLAYQFCDLVKGLVIALAQVDLLTFSLQSIPSLASLDAFPFVAFFVNFVENCILFYLAADWPNAHVVLVKVASVCTTFKALLTYAICGLILLGCLGLVVFGKRDAAVLSAIPPPKKKTE